MRVPAIPVPADRSPSRSLFLAAIALGALLRLAALPLPGTEDVGVWKVWSYNASLDVTRMYGIGGSPPTREVVRYGRAYTTVDYPPVALYEMGLAGVFYRGLFPGYPNDWRLTVAVKIPGLLAGAWLAWLLFEAVRAATGELGVARAATLACWLNPAILLNGEVLGYLDPLLLLPAVGSLLLVHQSRPFAAGCAVAIAALTKPQGALVVPIVLAAGAALGGWRVLRRAILGGVATTLVVFLPYILVGAVPNALNAFWSFARRDLLSAQAPNLWWIANWLERARNLLPELGFPGAYLAQVKGVMALSTFLESGWPNPRPIATAAVTIAAVWATRRAWLTRSPALHAAFAAFLVHAYYTLAVAVHENHILLAVPLLAFGAALEPRLRAPFVAITAIAWAAMSMFYGLGRGVGFVLPRGLVGLDLSVVNSFLNVVVFAWFGRRLATLAARETNPPRAASDGEPARG
jgi:hypothetical protein